MDAAAHRAVAPSVGGCRPGAGTQGQSGGAAASVRRGQPVTRARDRRRGGGRPEVPRTRPSSRRDRLQPENLYLRRDALGRPDSGSIVGQSATVRRVLEQARQVAATDSTVLLLGETGTGKELIAAHIHELSARRGRTMVRVNCAAIPGTLIESELFGREKGAFTGGAGETGRAVRAGRPFDDFSRRDRRPAARRAGQAAARARGAADRAARQSPAGARERQDRRRDPPRPRTAHCRRCVPARTSTTVSTSFRFSCRRCASAPTIFPRLVWRFVDEFSKSFGKRIETISQASMDALRRYPWPGNIRELRNVVERAMIVAAATS